MGSKLEALVCYYMLDLDISEEEASDLVMDNLKRKLLK